MVNIFAVPKAFTLPIIMLLATVGVWVLADVLYGNLAAPLVRDRILILAIIFLLSGVTIGSRLPLSTPFRPAIFAIFFIGTFLLTFVLNSTLSQGILASTEPLALLPIGSVVIPGGILLLVLLAYYEEIIFRFNLLRTQYIGPLISNVAFGVLHISSLVATMTKLGTPITAEGLLVPIGILILLGISWTYMALTVGIDAAFGSHVAWNIGVSGIL